VKFSVARLLAATAALLWLFPLAGCRSDHVEITIQNQTGAAIRLLEVDYPSASFGAQSLAAGASFHYRVQVQGSGQLTITYSDAHNVQPHITGPTLGDHQQGSLDVLLLPDGRAEFHPQFTSSH
jgi:hypothetical protein